MQINILTHTNGVAYFPDYKFHHYNLQNDSNNTTINNDNNLSYFIISLNSYDINYSTTTTTNTSTSMTSDNVNSTDIFTTLHYFNHRYQKIHGYLSLLVSLFGVFSNIINIIVLTRKSMISSATNLLLTALAIFDLLTMMSYVPFTIYFHCLTSLNPEENHKKGWIILLVFHSSFTITTHTCAIWITVALAVFRDNEIFSKGVHSFLASWKALQTSAEFSTQGNPDKYLN
ncbi:hypothetical protein HELRODRAFT_177236 [Helobdella robusta]|uniref:G-protein coupled receptors family 1 profile domain-containing protein n=1 Tax=Helobdella robusta TaxID=6412 RepID=T1FBE0_HELRO|nr:hypothetical protein HELRODRAFT_177236 [Helobdella robusta]ESN98351.1 hypothetical protein HELRODRAFT_177236 [Helobdella robusta]